MGIDRRVEPCDVCRQQIAFAGADSRSVFRKVADEDLRVQGSSDDARSG